MLNLSFFNIGSGMNAIRNEEFKHNIHHEEVIDGFKFRIIQEDFLQVVIFKAAPV